MVVAKVSAETAGLDDPATWSRVRVVEALVTAETPAIEIQGMINLARTT